MRRGLAVISTLALIVAYDVAVRSLFPSANPVTSFSVLLGSLTSLFFWLFIAEIRDFLPRAGQWVFAGILAAGLSVLLAVNLFTLWKLGDFVNAYMLMFVSVDRGFILDQIRLYALDWKTLALVPLFFLFFRIWKPGRPRPRRGGLRTGFAVVRTLLWFLLTLVALNQVKYETVGQHKWVDTSFLLAIKNFQKSNRMNVLRSSVRVEVPPWGQGPRPDIFLFLGESLGKQYLRIYGAESGSNPVFTGLFSGPRSAVFRQGLTNSSCTDVSLPSLFSGVGPEESDIKLHEMPLIWDWLKSAGYHTVFASPQKFAFANFDAFILSPGPHTYLSADRFMSLGSFMAHNNGLDDLWAAKRTAEQIAAAPKDKPLLLIFFTNATHYPFLQTSTELEEQPRFKSPYENSLWITDQSLKVLLDAFQNFRDPSKLMVLTAADHGELEKHARPVPRIASFYDEILAIPFALRFPEERGLVSEDCLATAQGNGGLLVQNLDLLPTLLDLLEFDRSDVHANLLAQLRGRSLCAPVGRERIIVGLNTNNIRQWNPEGFLLAKDAHRLVYTNSEGLKYFRIDQDPVQAKDLLPSIAPDLLEEFRSVIDGNLQLTRIRNLYFPGGLQSLIPTARESSRD